MKTHIHNAFLSLTLLILGFSTNAASERSDMAWQWIEQGATVIDVRTPAEFETGHIESALNLPLQSLASQLTELDKDSAYVVYCRSGNRSGQALNLLTRAGFLHVHNGGGIKEMLSSKSQ